MSCNISLGRLEGCKDQVGGLNAIYFLNFDDATYTIDASTEEASVVETTPSAYKYDLRGTSTFEQSLTSSRENGTTFVEQTLKLKIGTAAHLTCKLCLKIKPLRQSYLTLG